MVSQPINEDSTPHIRVQRPAPAHHSRFKELGAEYRRLTRIQGIPITQASTKAELPKTILHQPPPREPKPPASAPSNHDLERQVLKILQRYGRPIQKSEVLAQAIVSEALSQNYDPLFVAAVIKSESAFNSLARSHKGAQGLMQIMPKTGAWLADQVSLPRGKLTDPGHNLKLGITYLKQLEAEYGGNRVLTLVAYNWGPGHVESASKGRRRVPGQVMQYAVKILNDYRAWRSDVG